MLSSQRHIPLYHPKSSSMQIYFYTHPYIGDIKRTILKPVFHIIYCESLHVSKFTLEYAIFSILNTHFVLIGF